MVTGNLVTIQLHRREVKSCHDMDNVRFLILHTENFENTFYRISTELFTELPFLARQQFASETRFKVLGAVTSFRQSLFFYVSDHTVLANPSR